MALANDWSYLCIATNVIGIELLFDRPTITGAECVAFREKISNGENPFIKFAAPGWSYQFSYKGRRKQNAFESIANLFVLFVPFCG